MCCHYRGYDLHAQRRADVADELWRELVQRATGKESVSSERAEQSPTVCPLTERWFQRP
jgi:hypothetical protein